MFESGRDYHSDGGVFNEQRVRWEWVDDNGKLHRETGPAVINQITEKWNFRGEKHSADGVAIPGVVTKWYWHGKYHRETGPAIESENGSYVWYYHGTLHNLHGYAVFDTSDVFRINKNSRWYVDGIEYSTSEEFEAACDAYCQAHDIIIPGRLTKRANVPG